MDFNSSKVTIKYHLRLAPIKWIVIRSKDAAEFLKDKSKWTTYSSAASAQSVYFKDGTISAAKNIVPHLRKLNEKFPSVCQISSMLERISYDKDHYEFQSNGDIWHLRYTNEQPLDDPFFDDEWHMYWYSEEAVHTFEFKKGSFLEAMNLMSLLNGNLTLEEIVIIASNFREAKELLTALISTDAVKEIPNYSLEQKLPKFFFLGHSGLLASSKNSSIAVDPVLRPSNEIIDWQHGKGIQGLLNADAIFISHNHWDHLDFQTLVRIPRDKKFVIPKCIQENLANPSIRRYLNSLGFYNIIEVSPWENISVGDIVVKVVPFLGESFGLNSTFDGFTYLITIDNSSLYGSVDACHDERGSMIPVISALKEIAEIDVLLFGASGQTHERPYMAAGLRHFSNELKSKPELIHYHPNTKDVEHWISIVQPKCIIPYAEFIFDGLPSNDFVDGPLERIAMASAETARKAYGDSKYKDWMESLDALARKTNLPLIYLQPMQGLAF